MCNNPPRGLSLPTDTSSKNEVRGKSWTYHMISGKKNTWNFRDFFISYCDFFHDVSIKKLKFQAKDLVSAPTQSPCRRCLKMRGGELSRILLGMMNLQLEWSSIGNECNFRAPKFTARHQVWITHHRVKKLQLSNKPHLHFPPKKYIPLPPYESPRYSP